MATRSVLSRMPASYGHLGQEGGAKTGPHHLHQGVRTGGGERVDLALVPQPAGAHRVPVRQCSRSSRKMLWLGSSRSRTACAGPPPCGRASPCGKDPGRRSCCGSRRSPPAAPGSADRAALLQLLEQIGGGVFPQQQLQIRIGLAAHLQQLAQQEGAMVGCSPGAPCRT